MFPTSRVLSLLAVTTVVASLTGCTRKEAQAQSGDAPPPRSEGISSLDVPGDKKVLVIDGDPTVHRPVVHLHGMCADPREDLAAWGNTAKQHGTVVALVGDVPCPNKPGRTQWTTDPEAIHKRIEAAVQAVSSQRNVPLDLGETIVIGESMGAARAEALAAKFPDRYERLVLVGSPQTPSPEKLTGVRAVANLAGEREPQAKMKEGTRALDQAGTPTRFWEMPGATHGQYGPEGERIMGEALSFVATR